MLDPSIGYRTDELGDPKRVKAEFATATKSKWIKHEQASNWSIAWFEIAGTDCNRASAPSCFASNGRDTNLRIQAFVRIDWTFSQRIARSS